MFTNRVRNADKYIVSREKKLPKIPTFLTIRIDFNISYEFHARSQIVRINFPPSETLRKIRSFYYSVVSGLPTGLEYISRKEYRLCFPPPFLFDPSFRLPRVFVCQTRLPCRPICFERNRTVAIKMVPCTVACKLLSGANKLITKTGRRLRRSNFRAYAVWIYVGDKKR